MLPTRESESVLGVVLIEGIVASEAPRITRCYNLLKTHASSFLHHTIHLSCSLPELKDLCGEQWLSLWGIKNGERGKVG